MNTFGIHFNPYLKEMSDTLPEKIVSKMLDTDWFSQWLGIERVEVKQGYCVLRMTIRKEMLNGFGIAHGGITYSLADSALAFASNSLGRMSVSVETSISHIISLKEGDVITAVAEEVNISNKIGIYQVTIKKVTNNESERIYETGRGTDKKNKNDTIVALFKGTVYRTSKEWEITDNLVTNSESERIGETKKATNNEAANDESKRFYETGSYSDSKLIFPELSYKIIGSAFEIFNSIGGNHKEIVYQKALFETFQSNNIKVQQQVFNPVKIKEKTISKNYFDFLVENKIVVEIKSSDRFSKSHYDQLLNYLIVSKLKLGILISFGRDEVKYKRVLNIDLLNQEKISIS
ncbi:MAG: GxxExxY protein [Bacteroidota bacterium]